MCNRPPTVCHFVGLGLSKKSGHPESNRGLAMYKTGALPTALCPNVRFPLRLPLPPYICSNYGRFSAGIVILCEVFRYSHIIRELPGLTESEGVEPSVLYLPLWVRFTSTVIPSDGSLHFSAPGRTLFERLWISSPGLMFTYWLKLCLISRPNAHAGNCIRFSTSGRSRFF